MSPQQIALGAIVTKTKELLKFDVLNRFSGAVQFTAEIECGPDAAPSLKLGLAVKWAIKAGANLAGANLTGANLTRANLTGANLTGAKNAELAIAQTRILPDGDLIGWKKCQGGVIVKLRIPAEARRSHAFGRKCRAEYVDVIEVIGAEYGITRQHGPETHYRAGERVTPDGFDDNWQNECSQGIHFFITRAEAEAY